ncbi:MAG: hypothetical protein HRF49_10370 [bacterium]
MKLKLAFFLAVGLALLASLRPLSAQEFFALEDIYPGLKGKGKTVIEGTRIDEFDVEVIDVIPQGWIDGGPMILARMTGSVVDFSDGIAAGYSGSPVYFNGKLAGAVSSAIPGTDTHVGGITPIRSMMSALPPDEELDVSGKSVLPLASTQFSSGPGGMVVPEETTAPKIIWTTDWAKAEKMNKKGGGTLYAVPLGGELLIRGANPRALEKIKHIVNSNPLLSQLTPVQSRMTPKGFGFLKPRTPVTELQPGDAISFALVTGDFDLSGLGTLTYIDDAGRVLALGHPMFATGRANMPFGKAYVAYTYGDIMRGFKDGYMIGQSGTITTDQLSAVGGRIGLEPDMVELSVRVNDIDRGRDRTFNFKVIREKTLFEALVYAVTLQSYYEHLDRDGGGTIRIAYKIEADGLEKPFERENYFYDEYDAVSFLAAEALPTAALIVFNNYREIKIKKFSIDIKVTKNRVNASIDKAEIISPNGEAAAAPAAAPAHAAEAGGNSAEGEGNAQPQGANVQETQEVREPAPPKIEEEGAKTSPDLTVREFVPGEIVRLKVKLQPFRKDSIEQEFTIRIPRDFPTGSTSLIVQGGGGLVSVYNEFGGKGTVLFPVSGGPLPLGPEILSIDEALEKIQKGETNNLLMIVIPRPPTPEQQQAEAQGVSTEGLLTDEEKQVKVTVPMDFVIYDSFMIPINIVKEKTKTENGGASKNGK